MKKAGKFLTGLALLASLAGGVKNVNAQSIIVNPFVSTNPNGAAYDLAETRAQRDSIVQDFLDKDWVSEIAPSTASDPYVWDCNNYTSQILTNNNDWGEGINLYNGYSGFNLDSIYVNGGTLYNMGDGGLPFMEAYIDAPGNSSDHKQIAILTGDSLEGKLSIYENWNFVEPQFDQTNVQPGQAYLPENCDITINYYYTKENEEQGKYLSKVPIVKFKLTNRTPEFTWLNDDPNVKIYTERSQVTDTEFEDLKVYNPKQDSTYTGEVQFDYMLKDKNLDLNNSYYSVNGVKNYFSESEGTIPIESLDGENELEVYAVDKYGNSKDKIVNYNWKRTSGLEDKLNESKLNVYPNPATDYLKFNSEKDSPAQLRVYSIDGKEIENIYDNDGSIELDLVEYPQGIYLYKYESEGQVSTGKFVRK